MTVVAISCDQSLKREASPMPSTVRFSQRDGLLTEVFVGNTPFMSGFAGIFATDFFKPSEGQCQCRQNEEIKRG